MSRGKGGGESVPPRIATVGRPVPVRDPENGREQRRPELSRGEWIQLLLYGVAVLAFVAALIVAYQLAQAEQALLAFQSLVSGAVTAIALAAFAQLLQLVLEIRDALRER